MLTMIELNDRYYFLKRQYLYTMDWAMFVCSILYVDSYMQVFAS